MNKRQEEYLLNSYKREIETSTKELREAEFLKANGYPKSWSLLKFYEDQSDYPQYYFERKNNVVKIKARLIAPRANKNYERGEVTTFSRKSRKRLLEFLWSINWNMYENEQVREVTLTYHNDYPDDGEVVKTHLHNLRRHIMRDYPGTVLIWKLEYQKRGAPHFHIILITKKVIELGNYNIIKDGQVGYYDREKKTFLEQGEEGLRAYIQKKWSQVTGESIENFNSGVEVEVVRKKDRMAFYLCKYMAKEREYTNVISDHKVPEWFTNVGRWWGCYNRNELGIRTKKVQISQFQYEKMIEGVKQYWKDNNLPEYQITDFGTTLYAKDYISVQKYVIDPWLDAYIEKKW